jgi:diguanylate cyclase (GGDEF)-like protein
VNASPLPQLIVRDAKVAFLVIAGLLLLAVVDFTTGTEIRLYPLYFVPLGLAAYRMTLPGAVGCAVLATATWAVSNRLAGLTYSEPFIWVINVTGQLVAFLMLVLLVHRLRKKNETEHRLARTDLLTGLWNVRALYEIGESELERQRRHGHCLSVAYLDIDGFKRINDVLGHLGADQVLVQFADALRRSSRRSDFVARLGGDEFGVLLPHTGERELSMALTRLQAAVRERMQRAAVPVTFSIGGVTFTRAPTDVEALLAEADSLMYEVKAGGKNAARTRVYPLPDGSSESAAASPAAGE